MTTGSIVFFSGAGLFVVTIILAIAFFIKRPEYEPEKAANDGKERRTQSARSGYLTNHLTERQEQSSSARRQQGAVLGEHTELIDGTEIIEGAERLEKTEIITAAELADNGTKKTETKHTKTDLL